MTRRLYGDRARSPEGGRVSALGAVAMVPCEFAAEFDEARRRWVIEDTEQMVALFGRQRRVLPEEFSFDSVGEHEFWVAADLEEQVDECAVVVPGHGFTFHQHPPIVEAAA